MNNFLETPDYYKTSEGDLINQWVKKYGLSFTKKWCVATAEKYLKRLWEKNTPKENISKAIVLLNRCLILDGLPKVETVTEISPEGLEMLEKKGCEATINHYVISSNLTLSEWASNEKKELIIGAVTALYKALLVVENIEKYKQIGV